MSVSIDHARLTASLFAVAPVIAGQGHFDDRASATRYWRGLYTTIELAQSVSVDGYWLNYRNDRSVFDQGVGKEDRDTLGFRFFGARGKWSWNWEAMVQRGYFSGHTIRAWSFASETSYRFPGRPEPTLRLRANFASGDKNPNDSQLNTFNPLFPKGKYFGALSPIGPYNLVNLHPSVTLNFGKGVKLYLSGSAYWRASLADGVYGVSGQILRRAGSSQARSVGSRFETAAGWQIDSALSLAASFSLFTPGHFIKDDLPPLTPRERYT
jgi:hypothetical protein